MRLQTFLIVTLLAAPLAAAERHQIFYEIRAPKAATLADAHFELVTDQGSSGTRLHLAKKREEDRFMVYSDTCLLHPGERRRAIILRPVKGGQAQVFVLGIPRTPKPADWSQWQRPSYLENSDASWTFMHDLKPQERSTNLPPDCLETRYRITDWKSPTF